MKVIFEQLPGHAKVWMYQSERKLTSSEMDRIQNIADEFLSEWESHGMPVQGSVDVLQQLFIRVAAFTDEDSMCGRAQDAQVRLIKQVETALNVELTNRMLLAFGEAGQEEIVHLQELPARISQGDITPATPFYNGLIRSKEEFTSAWKNEASNTWLERYF